MLIRRPGSGASGKPELVGSWACSVERDGLTRRLKVSYAANATYRYEERELGGKLELLLVSEGNWQLSGDSLRMSEDRSEGFGADDMRGGNSFPQSFPVTIKLSSDALEGVTPLCTLKRDSGS